MTANIVIGAANFGTQYGIARKGKLSSQEIKKILSWAVGKVGEIDTSEDYEGSHSALTSYSRNFEITSKINLNKLETADYLEDRLTRICKDLNKEKLERVLLRPHKDPQVTICALSKLQALRSDGIIKDFGLSIYDVNELQYFVGVWDPPLTFQVPLNLLNRDFQHAFVSNRGLYENSRFYVRSIFLQGLLLMDAEKLPYNLQAAADYLRSLKRELTKRGSSILEATFAFIREQEWVAGIVMGISSLDELKTNIELFERAKAVDWSFLDSLPVPPKNIPDPRQW